MPPLLLEPFLRPQVWGGRRLRDRFGKAAESDAKIGESWEISGHPMHISRIAEGALAGKSLNDVWLAHRQQWCPRHDLAASPRFPLLVKLLDCGESSSLQVHPDNKHAARLFPGESGKTEAWYVLEAAPESRLYTGLRPGVTEFELRDHLAAGTVVDVMHAVTPQPGDAFLIPAGVPHAIGAGLVLFEIEQCSDITLRLFDWNRVDPHGRPRPVHIDEALRCLDWQHAAVDRATFRDLFDQTAHVRAERLLTCEWFVMDRITVTQPWSVAAGQLAIWFVVNGQGLLAVSDGSWSRSCSRGQTVLIPPGPQSLLWTPASDGSLELLRCSWGE